MASTIKIKNSSTAGAVPTSSDLVQGELAINVTDRRIFTENASGTVVELGTPSIDDNGNATAITIDSSENVGIGTSSPTQKLTVSGSGIVSSTLTVGQVAVGDSVLQVSSSYGGLRIGYNSTNVNFYDADTQYFRTTGGTERMRLDSSGNLLVGTTSASLTSGAGFKFIGNPSEPYMGIVTPTNGSGNTNYHLYSTGAGALRFYVGSNGQIFATSTSITAISDATLKENVRDLETGLSEVMALQPRRFDWKNGDGADVAGFIAQEVEQVLPELVYEYKYNADETKKAIKMGDILPTLVKAIQEQQALITTLTERITALEQA